MCSLKPEIVHLPAHTTLKRAWRVGDSQPQCWEGDLPPVQCDGPMSPLQPWIAPGLPVTPWLHPQDPPPPWIQDRLPHPMAHLGHSPPVDSPAWGPGGTSNTRAQHHQSLLEIQSFWGLTGAENPRITLLLCKISPSPSPVSPGSDPSPCIPTRLLKKATRDLLVGGSLPVSGSDKCPWGQPRGNKGPPSAWRHAGIPNPWAPSCGNHIARQALAWGQSPGVRDPAWG